jgi:hypothetical protein
LKQSASSIQGKLAKVSVFKGTKVKTASGGSAGLFVVCKAIYDVYGLRQTKTAGGLTKDKLTKSKSGKIITKASHAAGKKAYKNISGWTKACQAQFDVCVV